ncbi:high mobility group B protein 10-like protein, partial [Tanacetum coccineum]
MAMNWIPIIGGSSLDLHRLFIEVTSRGGFEKIPQQALFMDQLSGSVRICLSARQKVEVGGQVTGTIDNRFEQGYLVTVDLGNEKLSGFIYHLPSDASAPSHGTENMNQLALREPSPPEQDSSGYNVFYSEHYGRLKPLYHGQEDVIRKRIQVLWETLTQEEQQVYNVSAELLGTKGAVVH